MSSFHQKMFQTEYFLKREILKTNSLWPVTVANARFIVFPARPTICAYTIHPVPGIFVYNSSRTTLAVYPQVLILKHNPKCLV